MAILNTQDVILREGYLFKQSRSVWKLWKARYFVLRASGLSYYKQESDDRTSPLGVIAIRSISMHVDEIGEKKKRFCLKLSADGKNYVLCCYGEDERNAWLTAILTAFTSNLLLGEDAVDGLYFARDGSLSRSKSYDLLACKKTGLGKMKSSSLSSSITDIHRVAERESKDVPLSKRKQKALSVFDFKLRDSYFSFDW